MIEAPTGSYARGLGVGRAWFKRPIRVNKDFGPWSLAGGGGRVINNQVDYRSFCYGGFLVKRKISERLELSAELFAHGREGFAMPQVQATRMIDVGGHYHFHAPGRQLLFAYGHSVSAGTEQYAYLGV